MTNERSALPSFQALHGFVVAARYSSFTKAAAQLHVTPGAINRLVRSLEADLGVQLFERVGRSIVLTTVGAAYYPILSEAFETIITATRSMRAIHHRNVLVINVPSTFALRWLLPRLPSFRQQHPEILVDITTRDGPVSVANGRPDIAIIYGDGTQQGCISRLFMPEELGIFCAPSFLRSRRGLSSPTQLLNYPWLYNSTRPEIWQEYCEAYQIPYPQSDERWATFEHFFMVIEAAIGGMGIALVPLYLIGDEISSGRLIQPLPQTLKPEKAYYLLYSNQHTSRTIPIFERWIFAQRESPRE